MSTADVVAPKPAAMQSPFAGHLSRAPSAPLARLPSGALSRVSSLLGSCSAAMSGLRASLSAQLPDPRWQPLPAPVAQHVAGLLAGEHVGSTFRIVAKSAAEAEDAIPRHEHETVYMACPMPRRAFAAHWGRTDATLGLTLEQRRHLLCLTAATACLPSLQLLAARVGTPPSAHTLAAAAAAGRLDSCAWLRSQGCPWADPARPQAAGASALDWAAAAGCSEAVDWLLDAGCPWSEHVPAAAARNGHVQLLRRLLELHAFDARRYPVDGGALLAGAAHGCELGMLQELHTTWGEEGKQRHTFDPAADRQEVVAAAAASPTPDWRAKVEWLLGAAAFPAAATACRRVVVLPDAAERLEWMARAGVRLEPQDKDGASSDTTAGSSGLSFSSSANPLHWVAAGGTVDALHFLLQRGWQADARTAARAATSGNLPVLRELHARGCPVPPYAVREAAEGGHVGTVQWLVDTLGLQLGPQRDGLGCEMFRAAAEAGSVALAEWLAGRGCAMDAEAWLGAAHAGSGELLQWLADHGCDMPSDGGPYLYAGWNGDVGTMAALRRLGCPWDPTGDTFARAVGPSGGGGPGAGCPLAVLQWLLAEGCPVDWEAAAEAAERCGDAAVAEWVAAQQQSPRQEQGAVLPSLVAAAGHTLHCLASAGSGMLLGAGSGGAGALGTMGSGVLLRGASGRLMAAGGAAQAGRGPRVGRRGPRAAGAVGGGVSGNRCHSGLLTGRPSSRLGLVGAWRVGSSCLDDEEISAYDQ